MVETKNIANVLGKNAINIFHSIANSINCRNSSDNDDDSKFISFVEIVPFAHTYVKCGNNEKMSSWLSIWYNGIENCCTCCFVVCFSKMNDNLACYSVSTAVDCAEMQFYECISLY